ncbi:hypothetical protein [Desulfosudis oleivorans]|uniref:Uncharacterized protein n=1 Tax=Desulfosudis oleivorans (strain DSM 6200 / JCM 39069 / Hxd3) TaxID=96561 RepID=A8ZZ21_DESOH|nr:hypothetical protein [Desulfosudis oleivorans]ABW68794.1 hypothetical protein Dole_2991 [Desulfosudis oleivorans Hxd3]
MDFLIGTLFIVGFVAFFIAVGLVAIMAVELGRATIENDRKVVTPLILAGVLALFLGD